MAAVVRADGRCRQQQPTRKRRSIPATVVSLQMKAKSLSQGDRRPNGKPQTLPSSPAVPSRAAVGRGLRSPPAICRIDGTTTERTSVSSFLAPESRPRPPAQPTALPRPPQSECTAQTETALWSPSLPALGLTPRDFESGLTGRAGVLATLGGACLYFLGGRRCAAESGWHLGVWRRQRASEPRL